MVTGITERNKMKTELASLGYSMKYIDEWQPKTTLYRHKPSYNIAGEVSEGIGTTTKGVPGNPDYVLRKAHIGLFPWPPTEKCECKWCAERLVTTLSNVVEEQAEELEPIAICRECKQEFSSSTDAGALSMLRVHSKVHVSESTE